MTTIYKIVPTSLWDDAVAKGRFDGPPVDLADGYIHFSSAAQVRETAERHFADQADLVLLAVEVERLGEALKWEPSRGGALFPHLYAPLAPADVSSAVALPLGADGRHLFPKDIS